MRDTVFRLVFLMLAICSLNAAAGSVWKKGVTLPVVVEGSACNSASDKVGISSGNVVLSCQGDLWRASAITTGGGKAQIWKAVAGQTVTCNYAGQFFFQARVDASGNPYVRIYDTNNHSNTGWVAGNGVNSLWDQLHVEATIGGVMGVFNSATPIFCFAPWS